MYLDSSPRASTPKCSQTAGQNCSLHETKSSSRLKAKPEKMFEFTLIHQSRLHIYNYNPTSQFFLLSSHPIVCV